MIDAIAKQYIEDGWSVVPLNRGEKKASVRWQNTTYKPSDFNPDSNIAVKMGDPSNGLVDVDCDHPFAVAAAKKLLPVTRTFGRGADIARHYLYYCPGIRTTQFTDVKAKDGSTQMLVEIRSTSGYTMMPPSRHPSGDDVCWADTNAAIMHRASEAMYAEARSVALASIIAIHYPSHGARHFQVGQFLPGFLLQAKLDPLMVKQIIKVAAELAGDSDWTDREKAINATIAKFKNGENVAGGPKLAAEMGADVVAKMRAWLKCADVDALEEMNQRHFVTRLGTKTVIARIQPDGLLLQPVKELYPEYANRHVQTGTDKDGNATFGPLFETWLKSPNRHQYLGGIVNAPPPFDKDVREDQYNLWRGFAIQPQTGDWSLLRAHLFDIICSGNQTHYDYLIKWYAFAVQNPGIVPKVAVMLRGAQGSGKGTAVLPLELIFGQHYVHLSTSDSLIKWNALVSGKVVVFADEAFFAGDKQNLGNLKRIISEDTITIGRKHIDNSDERNCVHLMMATNEDWAYNAQKGERRLFALEISDAQAQRTEYFGPLVAEIHHGGAAAFLHFLLEQDVTLADVLAVPKTAELRNQQNQSLPFEMQWLQECLFDGFIGQIAWTAVPIPTSRVYDAYKLWVRDHTTHVLTKDGFIKRMGKFMSAVGIKRARINGENVRCWVLRDLDDARNVLDEQLKTPTEWPDGPGASGNAGIPF